MTSSTRDNRRQRLYDAERAVFTVAGKPEPSAPARRYLLAGKRVTSTGNLSIEACQRYVDHVTSSAWFQRRWGRRSFTVRHKVYGSATGGHNVISLPPWAREEWVILHEIAHNIVGVNPEGGAHGPRFAAAYLVLVKHTLGAEAYRRLREQMREHGVRVAALPGPDPDRIVQPRSEVEARKRAAEKARAERVKAEREREQQQRQRRAIGSEARAQAATTIRELVKLGVYGPAGTKTRQAALATARGLEATAAAQASQAARRELRAATG